MATVFQNLAPRVVSDLMRELGLTDVQAAGFVGNFGAESGLISGRQEGTSATSRPYPIRGFKGGIDWPQWTASRRTAFADWVEATGTKYPSYEASLGFVLHELRTTHKHAVAQVKKTRTVKAAAETAEAHYEMAGIKNMGVRIAMAQQALDLYRASPYAKKEPVPVPTPPVPGPLPDAKPTLQSRTIITNLVGAAVVALAAWNPKFILTPEQQEIFITALVALWAGLSTYFRANASQPVAGSPLAQAIDEARRQIDANSAAPAQAAGPAEPVSLFDLPMATILDELPALLAAIRNVQPEPQKLLEHKPSEHD